MKKLLTIFLSLIFMTFNISADTVYEKTTTETVTRGLVHTYTQRLTTSGWQKVNVLTADLTDKNIAVTSMYDLRGISYKTTTSKMTASNGAVAGINADFFDFTTPSGRTTPLGLTVKDGDLISTASHDTNLAALAIAGDTAIADYFKTEVYLCADNGNKAQILHINKYHPTASIVMFTPDWGTETPGTEDGSCEMVVSKDKVTEIKTGEPPTAIPSDGYVLRVDPSINNFFAENFEEGDNAEIEVTISPDIEEDIDTSVGGGTILVSKGKVATFTNNIAGYNPRSAAGISKDGKTLYLVTVEGREKNTPGMTQTELAELMISLGSYTAINFDGGGSTAMALRDKNGNITLANTPSEGAERAVSTGIGVKSVGKDAHFAYMSLSASKENVFAGDSVEIWCAPLDNYYNPTVLEYPLEFAADDGGRFEDNRYYPNAAGKRTVTVTAGDVIGQIEINVLDNIANLSLYPAVFTGQSAYLSLVAADENGFKSQITPENAVWDTDSGNAEIKNGNISCSGTVTVSASFAGKTAYAYGNMQTAPAFQFYDSLQGSVQSASFVVMPSKLEGNTFLNCILNNFIEKKAEKEKSVFAFSSYNADVVPLTAFSESSQKNTDFICLNNSKSVFEGGVNQWQSLISLKNSDNKNTVIFLSSGNNFTDASEKSMFKAILLDLYESGKTVFVITAGDSNGVDIENGVHYLTLKKYPAVDLQDYDLTKNDAKYLRFSIIGDKITYEFAKIFE
ncbi:MAG: phosphodiester glycosidase family protein [Clostridia bacterium]|nr:phosphodiester glycosidase family protein [Clostridia bacterium]